MITRPAQPVSTLDDLLELVRRIFAEIGDGTPVMIGKEHLEDVGAAPRVVFVPLVPGSGIGAPRQVAARLVASRIAKCTCHIRGAESGHEDTRRQATYRLSDRVVNALRAAAPGSLVLAPADSRDASPTGYEGYGFGEAFTFTFTGDIAEDEEIRAALEAVLMAQSPVDPDRPEGDTGGTFTVTTPADPQ